MSMPPDWLCPRVSSTRRSVFSMPHADSTDAAIGTTTRRTPSSAATAVTCSPAAPPNARIAKPRGSTPRRTVATRTPSAMRVFTSRWMPPAACSGVRPSRPASRHTAATAASRSNVRRPPRKLPGSR